MLFWLQCKNRDVFRIGESRLVFLQTLKLKEFEALERLPTSSTPGMAPLENQLSTLQEQVRVRRQRRRIGQVLGRVLGEESVEEMTQKLWNCEQVMQTLKSPIENPDQFRESYHQIKSYDKLLERLKSSDFDEIDIQNLLESDLRPFFSKKLVGKLLRAQTKMTVAEEALSRINEPEARRMEEGAIADEEKRLQELLVKGRDPEYEALAGRETDKGYQELVRRSLTNRDARQHRARARAQFLNTPLVADKLSYEEKLELANLFLEAREIRLEQLRQYLRGRYDKLRAGYEKAQSRFSERDRETLAIIFREAEEWFPRLTSIEAAQNLNQNLDFAENHLKASNESLNEIEENRPRIETEIRVHFRDLKAQLQTLTPERLAALIAQAEKDPKVYGGHAEALRGLQDPHSPFWAQVREFEERLGHPGEMELTELQAAREELKTLERVLGLDNNYGEKIDGALNPERLKASQKARKAIESLKGVTSIEAIRKTLNETIGSDHVRTVDHATFEARYRAYTTTGHMVFYERGSAWAIIADEEALSDEKNVATLQKQLTHELLHLEFERNDELKAEWLKTFTTHEDWPQIKAAYVEAFPGKKPAQYEGPDKTTYTADDWKDEDILSELFAMQNALGDATRPAKDTPLGRLRSLTLPIAAALGLGIKDTEQAKKIVRGYDGDDVSDTVSEGEGGATKELSETTKGSYENYRDQIEEFERNINDILGSEYMGYVPVMAELLRAMKQFNENSRAINEEFKKTGSDFLNTLLMERNKKLKKDLEDIMKNLATVGGEIPNKTMNVFRRIWIHTSFLALTDIFQAVKDVVEYVKRRHERKKADHAAKLGMALFANTDLGREAKARELKAEDTEVNEWKGRYEKTDAWELYKIIDNMAKSPDPNKDQLKAILRILCEKGRMNWRHEGLWKVLNKLQSAVHLTPGDPVLLHNPPLLRQKLHSATGAIWDYDEYTTLEKTNEDAYDSSKKKFFPSLDRIQDQLTDRLEQLLRMKREGRNVLASEYEAVLDYAVEKGKSYQEAVLFYLMMGIIEGILTPDRGLALDRYLNQFPATQWIYSKRPPLAKKDYESVAQKYFPESLKTGTVRPDFKEFFWTKVQNDDMTMQRVQKSVSERGWDHDWTRGIAGGFDAHTAKRFLAGKSGQEEAKITGIQNAVTGLVQWFEENAKGANKIDFRRHFTHRIGALAMMDGIFHDVAYQKATGHAPFTRLSGSVASGVAREAGVGNHADWNTRQHWEKMQTFLDLFDQPLFQMLRSKKEAHADPEGHATRIVTYLKEHYRQDTAKWDEFKTLDHIFEDMDTVIQIVTSSRYVSDAEFLKRIAWLRQGL